MTIHSAMVLEVSRYRRQLVGEFMDAHTGVFSLPAVAPRWVDFFAQIEGQEVEGVERMQVEKAVGMFAQVFRQAQYAMLSDTQMRLDEFLSEENFPGIKEVVVPDPVALLIVGGADSTEHTPETVAFARTMSVFKFLIRSGSVSADVMYQAMCRGLDDLPGDSPIQRSLIEAVKQMVQRDMEMMLRNDLPETVH